MTRLAVLAAWLSSPGATASVRMDVLEGVWRDDFTDLGGLASNRQGAMAFPTGYTIDSGIQTLTWPYSASGFSEPFTAAGSQTDPTLVVGQAGSSAEYLTLSHDRYDPGAQLKYPSECLSWKGESCKGQASYMESGVDVSQWLRNVPLDQSSWLPMVGWDTASGHDWCPELKKSIDYIFCRTPKNPTDATPNPPDMTLFLGEPLLRGLALNRLAPNRGYTATFTAGAHLKAHISHTGTAYLRFEIRDNTAKKAAASVTLYEGQFFTDNLPVQAGKAIPGPDGVDFNTITTVSIHLDPAKNLPGHTWDLRAYGEVAQRTPGTDLGCTHCTMLGPVWLTADEGTYVSAVFDSLSNATRWENICWVADMSTVYVDSSISPLVKGVPLTPVKLSYSVSATASPTLPVTFTVTHGGEGIAGVIGMNMVNNACNPIHDAAGASVTGRYFQWSAQLLGRIASAMLDADLAPGPGALYFGALRPVLRQVAVHYYVCAARAQSRRIAPTSVRRWGTVDYVVDRPSGASVMRVDVVSAEGDVLLADVAPGTSLDSLDPYRYPSLALRASLESDPGDCARRPVLRAWQVTWEPLHDVLEITCNSIRPALGEECLMQIRMDRAGPARVEIHDAAGQSVKVLVDGVLPAEARLMSWDGRNAGGSLVAAGVYFVVAKVPGGRRVKKLAVTR